MFKLNWDATGERLYETGIDRGVLYPMGAAGYGNGVAWNGLISVQENPTGAEANPKYADNIKYLNLFSAEEYGCTIQAYTYPPEFGECDGTAEPVEGVSLGQQSRKLFGFCYRTLIGNDVNGQEHGYKLHLVYGAQASPSDREYQTVNDSPDAITFSWEVTTTPVNVAEYKPVSSITINSTRVDAAKLAALEKKLYGDETSEPTLPLPSEVLTMMKVA